MISEIIAGGNAHEMAVRIMKSDVIVYGVSIVKYPPVVFIEVNVALCIGLNFTFGAYDDRVCEKRTGRFVKKHINLPDNLSISCMVCNIKFGGRHKDEILHFLRNFELENDKDVRLSDCSLGMKKKVGIIVSFIGFFKLIILDEPTNGVDTTGLIMLKKYIEKAKANGCIVIVSSHVLDFVDTIKDDIIFLKNGHAVVGKGTTTEEQYKDLFMNISG